MKKMDQNRKSLVISGETLSQKAYQSMKELQKCKLCSWECGVNRINNEHGVCLIGLPEVASCQLHPAPPASYTVFTVSCNFKCLNCQNWEITHGYLQDSTQSLGWVNPRSIAKESIHAINSFGGKLIGADRLFFSGGSPTISLPWIEQVIAEVKKIDPMIKVNFDTNGFETKRSFDRVLRISDSITFDIKAVNDRLHRELTGAPVEPVLQNVEAMAHHSKKLWEFRVLVIPRIVNQLEIADLAEFIAALDPTLPVCFLAFRPNFCLDHHPGASHKLMKRAIETAKTKGLERVSYTGFTDIPGTAIELDPSIRTEFQREEEQIASTYAQRAGCQMTPRTCGICDQKQNCPLKQYIPTRST